MERNIMRRLLSSLIDKLFIVILFVIVTICLSPYKAPGMLGKYYGLIDTPPSKYQFYDKTMAMDDLYGDKRYESVEKWQEYYESIQNNTEVIKTYRGRTLHNDLYITTIFILINFVYYLLWESILKASLGKTICGLKITSKERIPIFASKAVLRSIILLLLMIIAVALRFAFDTSYFITIIAFFIILDTSVFLSGRSLIDIISNTYINRKVK